MHVPVDDGDAFVGQGMAATDQRSAAWLIQRVVRRDLLHLATGERSRGKAADRWRLEGLPSGDDQGRFRQSKTGIERLAAETAGTERFREAFQRVLPHRFRTVERHTPRAEVQLLAFLGRDLTHTQVVGEVRPPAGSAAKPADRRKPAKRLLKKRHRRHENVRPPHVEWLQNSPDQAHVVIAGKPKHSQAGTRVLESVGDQGRIVQQIGVAQHDPFRRARRTRGVLQKGDRVAAHVGRTPTVFHGFRHPRGRQPGKRFQVRRFVDQRLDAGQHVVCGQRHLGPGVVSHRLDALQRTIPAGRVDRYGHHAGIQAPKERADEIQPGRVQQQGPLSAQTERLEPGPDRPGASVEFPIGEMDLLVLAIEQVGESHVIRLTPGAMTDEFDQVGWTEKSSQ